MRLVLLCQPCRKSIRCRNRLSGHGSVQEGQGVLTVISVRRQTVLAGRFCYMQDSGFTTEQLLAAVYYSVI